MRRLPIASSSTEWSRRSRRHSEPFNQRVEPTTTSAAAAAATSNVFHPLAVPPPEFNFPIGPAAAAAEEAAKEQIKHERGHLSMPKRVRSQSLPGHFDHDKASASPSSLTNNYSNVAATTTRRALYPTHIPVPDAIHLIQTRQLFSGMLSVDLQDSSDAFVACEELGSDIYIYGSRNRNRALDGDHVAVELVDVENMLAEKASKKQARRRSSLAAATLHSIPEESVAPSVSSTTNDVMRRPAYCGKVVSILERPKRMLFSGTLSLDRPSSTAASMTHPAFFQQPPIAPLQQQQQQQKPSIIWFVPADKRLPLVAVPVKHAPYGFIKYHEEFRHRIFIGSIQRWPATSLHPFGTIEREIGYMGELSVHSQALMADHHLKDSCEFTKGVHKSADAVESVNHSKRLDLRHLALFTVSDSDGGEHTTLADHGFTVQCFEAEDLFEIGVHTIDLAGLVRPNTLLDREAKDRAVTVDLVERQVPIFPPTFTNTHAELSPGKERASLSVLCRVTRSGKLIHSWIGKTIVKCRDHLESDNISRAMLDACKALQTTRLKEGGSSLAISYQKFSLADSGYPQSITRIHKNDDHPLVLLKEAVILAGQEVGRKITSRLPEHALLCRQQAPPSTNEEYTQRHCGRSVYFCSGNVDIARYQHHSYAASLYTVFAEPLHKYACIVVQRQLHAALKREKDGSSSTTTNSSDDSQGSNKEMDTIDKLARHCNAKEFARDSAYEHSVALYIAAYIYRQSLDKKEKSLLQQATIVSLQPPYSLIIFISEYGLEKEIHILNCKDIHTVSFDPATDTMQLIWHTPSLTFAPTLAPQLSPAPHPSTASPSPAAEQDSELAVEQQEHNRYQASSVRQGSVVDIRIVSDMKVIRPGLEIQLVNPFKNKQ
ncbi:hypothetical protein BDB00DRAFT_799626 [Zychaea mexicana]|uniref:uncharacterized protein n=1 Tax=Zychaea mexicana TaxID=64656 RepID=UPI0022FF074B|nr:uncharacterized protein BDB00DRAFT_799626 [Zychaea mexicana]KAI9498817.1 hypothetical protein BDB00DRAFT_799626 [Zychaea mexicana]